MKVRRPLLVLLFLLIGARPFHAQENWFRTGINLGMERIRLAIARFEPQSVQQPLVSGANVFNEVLRNDLDNAGIFDLVSPSFHPLKNPRTPPEVDFEIWSGPPIETQMLVFGSMETLRGNLVVTARVFDVRSPENPTVLAKRYVTALTDNAARQTAHRLADEIILNLGGGLPGINSSRIAFVSKRSGHEEIMVMDYDGYNQVPITRYRSLCLTPRWSPDNTKLAFTSYASGNPQIYIHSLETNRRMPFPSYRGLTTTPAFSPDGKKIAFCSSMSGDPELYVSDTRGFNLRRLTYTRGVDISPVWNPRTGTEIAFISDRGGGPQLYILDASGANLRRVITQGGDVANPSWSPNGQFLAFAWSVRETGHYDIYVLEISTSRVIQLTHDAGRNERPSWAPDGRHIVFTSTRTGSRQIWMMLSDGSNPKQLTTKGWNWSPVWSK